MTIVLAVICDVGMYAYSGRYVGQQWVQDAQDKWAKAEYHNAQLPN